MSIVETVVGVISNKCPKCDDGKVFGSLVKINKSCPTCGYLFEREQGYFTGAMVFSYILGFFAILPTFLIMAYLDTSFVWMVLIPSTELIILAPLSFRFSRLVWIYVDYRITPKT